MKEISKRERQIDYAMLIIFPAVLIVSAVLAYTGNSSANYGESYVATTQAVSCLVVIILPLLRIYNKFRAPYWLIFIVTGCIYMHALSLYMGWYQGQGIPEWLDWSVVAHSVAGVVVTVIVFVGMCVIQTYTRAVNLGIYPLLFMCLFITLGFGCLWELMEWTVDTVSAQQYMSYSVFDTTDDLVSDLIGSSLTLFVLWMYFRKKDMVEFVESVNLGDKMRVVGAKWDNKCGMNVYVPKEGEETSIDFGKWEHKKPDQ